MSTPRLTMYLSCASLFLSEIILSIILHFLTYMTHLARDFKSGRGENPRKEENLFCAGNDIGVKQLPVQFHLVKIGSREA